MEQEHPVRQCERFHRNRRSHHPDNGRKPSGREKDKDLICVYDGDGNVRRIEVKSIYKDMYGQALNLIEMIETDGPGVISIDEVYSALRVVQTAQMAIDTGRVLSPLETFPDA